jgi:hypothetical protein
MRDKENPFVYEYRDRTVSNCVLNSFIVSSVSTRCSYRMVSFLPAAKDCAVRAVFLICRPFTFRSAKSWICDSVKLAPILARNALQTCAFDDCDSASK